MIINRNKVGRATNDVERQCSAFEALCRSRGIRVTPQRLAVYRALSESLAHPSAESVYRQLSSRFPTLSQATVYRTLEFLEKENLIRRVSAPEGTGRFDANLDKHQHLICRICGTLTDVSVPELHETKLPTVSGFTVEELDIRLVGRCRDCSDLARKGSVRRSRGRKKSVS
ncbi:MAG: transcriptional repressor [Blastocatellia bacterium AA13]|nr:MAG: transcriptional repressor [Blastocatellia bacterium AA13]